MDLISDPDRFEDAIRALRELAAEGQAYRRGGSLDHLLEGLIGAALSEFGPDKFDMPRRAGDLADADGIRHLLADYGPAFLNAREEAAASLALKLFLARDFLKLGFGLPDETIREIEERAERCFPGVRIAGSTPWNRLRNRARPSLIGWQICAKGPPEKAPSIPNRPKRTGAHMTQTRPPRRRANSIKRIESGLF